MRTTKQNTTYNKKRYNIFFHKRPLSYGEKKQIQKAAYLKAAFYSKNLF